MITSLPGPTARPRRALHPALLALLLAALLLSSLPARRLDPLPQPIPAAQESAPETALPDDPFAAPAPPAPSLLARPDLVERREEFARHYDLGDGRYLAL